MGRKLIRPNKLRLLVINYAGEEQQQYLFSRPKRMKRAAAQQLRSWMLKNSGVKCNEKVAEEVSRQLTKGEVYEAMETWNDFQHQDAQPKALIWALQVELDMPAADFGPDKDEIEEDETGDTACDRCGSDINESGFCTDQTCLFSEHKQGCPAGWTNHTDLQPAGPCNCWRSDPDQNPELAEDDFVDVTDKEASTVVAALRHFKSSFHPTLCAKDGFPEFDECDPLTDDEIGELIGRIKGPSRLTMRTDLLSQHGEPGSCILTGAPGEDPDDCTTHEHEPPDEDNDATP